MDDLISLAELKVGDKAVITGFSTEDVPIKFHEMGFLPGTKITLVRKAPLNGPFCVVLGDDISIIVLRKREATCVRVERKNG